MSEDEEEAEADLSGDDRDSSPLTLDDFGSRQPLAERGQLDQQESGVLSECENKEEAETAVASDNGDESHKTPQIVDSKQDPTEAEKSPDRKTGVGVAIGVTGEESKVSEPIWSEVPSSLRPALKSQPEFSSGTENRMEELLDSNVPSQKSESLLKPSGYFGQYKYFLPLLVVPLASLSGFVFTRQTEEIEGTTRRSLDELRMPLEEFCRNKPPPLQCDRRKLLNGTENYDKLFFIMDYANMTFAQDINENLTKLTKSLLDGVDGELWPTVGNFPDFLRSLSGVPFDFDVRHGSANALVQLLKAGAGDNFFAPIMEKAIKAQALVKQSDPDWVLQENQFFEDTRAGDLFPGGVRKTVIVYEGTPQDLYWTLRLRTHCEKPGQREVSFKEYQTALQKLRGKMRTFA